MNTDTLFIQGTQVMLMGTKHTRIYDNHNHDPQSQKEYIILNNFQPDLIFVELTDGKNLRLKSKNFTDLSAIYKYKIENDTKTVNYDSESQKTYLEYKVYQPDDLEKQLEKTNNKTEYRKVLKEKYPEMFYDIYEQRENKSIINFISDMNKYNKVVIHCGLNHYNTYRNFFKFMSEDY